MANTTGYNQYDPAGVNQNTGEWTDKDLHKWWGDIEQDTVANRDAAMDWSEQYGYQPEDVSLLSDRLNTVLQNDNTGVSKYIDRARTRATEDAGARGLLNSSMAAGAAEGAAIDRGLQVAEGDVGVDKFNVGQQTDRDASRYQAAQGLAGAAYDSQNRLGDVGAQFASNQWLNKQGHEQNKELADIEQQYGLINKQYEHELNMLSDDARYKHERLIQTMGDDTKMFGDYLDSMESVMSADLDPADKEAQLNKLTSEYQNYFDNRTDWENTDFTMPPTPDAPTGEGEFNKFVLENEIDGNYLVDLQANDPEYYNQLMNAWGDDETMAGINLDTPEGLAAAQKWVYDYVNGSNTPVDPQGGGVLGQPEDEVYFGDGSGAPVPPTAPDTEFNQAPTSADITPDYMQQFGEQYPDEANQVLTFLQDRGLNSSLLTPDVASAMTADLVQQALTGGELRIKPTPPGEVGLSFTNAQGQQQVFNDNAVTTEEYEWLKKQGPEVSAGVDAAIAEFQAIYQQYIDATGQVPDDYNAQLYARAAYDKHVYGPYGYVDFAAKYPQ